MYEFSLDQSIESIRDSKTQRLMKEVLSNYYGENYRSASVMLWTVIVCDLVFKLKELKELYSDKVAENLLVEMQGKQVARPTDSSWEMDLAIGVSDKTRLISKTELLEIKNIYTHRNLSAHPIISQDDILYRPTREIVLADIRNALEIVLAKPAILSKSIFDEIMTDLESIANILPKNNDLSIYLNDKYFRRIDKIVSFQVFKSMWRVSFGAEDPRADKNRNINYRALRVLYISKRATLLDLFQTEKDFFSKILPIDKCPYYIYLISDYVELYGCLNEAAKIKINNELIANLPCNLIAYFTSPNMKTHINNIFDLLNGKNAKGLDIKVPAAHVLDLYVHSQSSGCGNLVLDEVVKLYSISTSYDSADTVFECFVAPLLSDFDLMRLDRMFQASNMNSQLHARRSAKSANATLLKAAQKIDPAYSIANYSNLSV